MAKRPAGTGTARQRGRDTWEYRITIGTDATGKQIRRSCTIKAKNKTEAERLGREKLAHLVEAHSPTPGGRSLATAFEIWLADTEDAKAPNTVLAHRRQFARYVEPKLGPTPISEIHPSTLEDFYRDLRRGDATQRPLAPSSINRIHNIVSGTLRHALRRGWIDANPSAAAEPPRIPHRNNVMDVDNGLVWKAIEALWAVNPAHGCAAVIAFHTGLRRGEVAALTWGSISQDRLITIDRSVWKSGGSGGIKGTKTERVRMVPVSEGLYKFLNAWFQMCEQQGEPTSRLEMKDWFITADGDDRTEPMNIDHLTYRWTKAAEAVGLKDFPFKSFRSLAATRLLASGISPVDAAQWLGHASPTMTLNVYGRGTTPGKLQSMAVLDQATKTEGIFLSATSGNLGPDRLARQRTNSILDSLEGGIDEEKAVRVTKPGSGLPGTPQDGTKSIWDDAPPLLASFLDVENGELRRLLED